MMIALYAYERATKTKDLRRREMVDELSDAAAANGRPDDAAALRAAYEDYETTSTGEYAGIAGGAALGGVLGGLIGSAAAGPVGLLVGIIVGMGAGGGITWGGIRASDGTKFFKAEELARTGQPVPLPLEIGIVGETEGM